MASNKVVSLWCRIFKNSRDPVKILPKKVMEKILCLVRGNDLLRLSLVSKDWYEFIGNSDKCMDKIRIHITEYFLHQKRVFSTTDVLRFIENQRKYKHLSIACITSHNLRSQEFSSDHKLCMALYQWKTISLCNHLFQDEMEFVNFLGFVEPFVEELELRTVKIRNFIGICETNFEFPKLKVLRLVNVSNFVYLEPFKNVSHLVEFSVATEPFLPSYKDSSDEIQERTKCIRKILVKNRHIKDLELFLDQKDFDCMFINRNFVSQIDFKLKSLMVGRFKQLNNERRNNFQLKSFVFFLRQHTQSLREIYLPECLGNDVIEVVINEMVELEILTIQEIESYDNYRDLILIPNESIQHLTMASKTFTELVTKLLISVPKLKQLKTGTIDQRILNVIAKQNPVLESISVDFFTASLLPQEPILRNLKQMVISINSSNYFRDLIGEKAEYTNFEAVFLSSAKNLRRKWDVNNQSFYKC